MSKVPPSPAMTRTVVSPFPCTSRAALTPAAATAPVAKGVLYTGTFSAEFGNVPHTMEKQLAGITTIVFGPRTSMAFLMINGAPHPAQARCPLPQRPSGVSGPFVFGSVVSGRWFMFAPPPRCLPARASFPNTPPGRSPRCLPESHPHRRPPPRSRTPADAPLPCCTGRP